MPLRPNFFERLALFRLNRAPGPLFDSIAAQSFKAVLAAVRLGIFEALGNDRLSAEQVAGRTGTSGRTLPYLLDALASLGYLSRSGGCYRNTGMTRRWMLSSSPDCLSGIFEFFNGSLDRWEYLHETVKNGVPPRLGWEWLDELPGRWEAYHRGMAAIATLIAPRLARLVPVPRGAKKILDLGGGHGIYCARLCKKHPGLEGTILDLPHAGPLAMATIASHSLSDRVRFQACDFLREPLGGEYDVVLLFNVIRILDPAGLENLLERVRPLLTPKGILVIMDQVENAPSFSFLKASTHAIMLELVNSISGRLYGWKELASTARDLGYRNIRHARIPRSPGLGLIIASRTKA